MPPRLTALEGSTVTRTGQRMFFLACIVGGALAITLASIFTQADRKYDERRKLEQSSRPAATGSTRPAETN